MELTKALPGYLDSAGKRIDTNWWIEQIRAGIKDRDAWTRASSWPNWDSYYRSDYPVASARLATKDVLPVNLFYIMARSLVPRVYFRNPSISVTSARPGPDGLGLSVLMERIDNKLLKTMNVKATLKKVINTAFFRGTGVSKLGFGAQYQPIGHAQQIADSATARGANLEYRVGLDSMMPWLAPMLTEHYVLPANTIDRANAPWEAHIILRDTIELRLDPRMKNTAGIGPTHQSPGAPGSADLTETWEIHDRRTGKVFVMMPNDSEARRAILVEPGYDASASPNGGPFYPIAFNDNLNIFWGMPDGAILEPLQEELNEIMTLIMYHRRLALRKFRADKNTITADEALALLTENDVGAVIFGEKGALETIQVLGIPDDLFKAFDRVMEIVRLTFGFSRNQAGEFQGGSEKPTAAETMVVQQATAIRVDERRDLMADYLVSIIEDTNRLIYEHWHTERVQQVVGPFGIPIWVKYTGEMLRGGKFELNIDPDSGLPETRALREARAKELYGLLWPLSQKPDAQTGRPLINSTKLTRFLLHETQGTAWDDMLLGVPNIYDEEFVKMLGGGESSQQPMEPAQFGQLMQRAGPAGMASAKMLQGAGNAPLVNNAPAL